MLITVERILSDSDATLSIVQVDDEFVCFGLEDEHREHKIPGETRIMAGHYKVGVRNVGGFDSLYRKKFQGMHQGMLQILDVPHFEHILIHIGNTDKDTAGCLLVGDGASTSGEIRVTNSTSAYKKLYNKVIHAALDGNLEIIYMDEDLNNERNI